MRMLKIFLLLLLIISTLFIFVQNGGESVDVDVFHLTFTNQSLTIVLFIATVVGIMIGFLLAAIQYFLAKTESIRLARENKQLREEINNIRNLSLDDITIEESDKPEPAISKEHTEEEKSNLSK